MREPWIDKEQTPGTGILPVSIFSAMFQVDARAGWRARLRCSMPTSAPGGVPGVRSDGGATGIGDGAGAV